MFHKVNFLGKLGENFPKSKIDKTPQSCWFGTRQKHKVNVFHDT